MKNTFYHSTTGQPFKATDCEEDSEDEIDDSWIQEIEEKQIDELSNISQTSKSFMKLWNKHLYENRLSNIFIKQACITFIEKYFKAIQKMSDCWSLHLVTLLEYHALTGDDLLYLQLLLNSKNLL